MKYIRALYDVEEYEPLNFDEAKETMTIVERLIALRRPIKTSTLYGAIWIMGDNDEPILKSVSQMNEKGELELLLNI